MECNEYRHVCFKDLENYFKKDEYLGGLTEDEQALIRKNIGISDSILEDSDYRIIQGTYDEIKQLADTSQLRIGNIYIITDFRTIYQCDDKVLGTNDSEYPSQLYKVILTPISDHSFNTNVILSSNENCSNISKWEVQYDITQETIGAIKTKGKITFLRDQNNNYAYYDFKNIRFKRTVEELEKGATTYTQDTYFYTFDNGGKDASEGTNCKNNHLESGCYNTIFISGEAQNNSFQADCHNNTFFKDCLNSNFQYGTCNNYFTVDVIQTRGVVHDRTISTIVDLQVPKEFNSLNGIQIVIYIDAQTETYQVKKI